MNIQTGMHVISVKGETFDHGMGEFSSGPCALGVVTEVAGDRHDERYTVYFGAVGASIFLTQEEIESDAYVVTANPHALCKVAICYYGVSEVSYYLVAAAQGYDLARDMEMLPNVRHATNYPLT